MLLISHNLRPHHRQRVSLNLSPAEEQILESLVVFSHQKRLISATPAGVEAKARLLASSFIWYILAALALGKTPLSRSHASYE